MENHTKNQKPAFEKALAELEETVNKMEDSNLSLDKMMEYFEKGKKLSAYCGRQLSQYEKKIEILVNKKATNEKDAWEEYQEDLL